MSWALFIDKSSRDLRHFPYEVFAGLAVDDRRIWPLIRQPSDPQQLHFGMRLFEAQGREATFKNIIRQSRRARVLCRRNMEA